MLPACDCCIININSKEKPFVVHCFVGLSCSRLVVKHWLWSMSWYGSTWRPYGSPAPQSLTPIPVSDSRSTDERVKRLRPDGEPAEAALRILANDSAVPSTVNATSASGYPLPASGLPATQVYMSYHHDMFGQPAVPGMSSSGLWYPGPALQVRALCAYVRWSR